MVTGTTSAQILLVEDNPADSRLLLEALKASESPHRLLVARDGTEAMRMLNSSRASAPDFPRPDLILLDLNLPGKSGWEVLDEIKQRDDLREIPVVILTSSRSPEDVAKAYRSHANSYLCKPVRLADVFALVSDLQKYWFDVASIPSRISRG